LAQPCWKRVGECMGRRQLSWREKIGEGGRMGGTELGLGWVIQPRALGVFITYMHDRVNRVVDLREV